MADISLASLIHALVVPPLCFLLSLLLGLLIQGKFPSVGKIIVRLSIVLLLVLSTNAGALLIMQPLEALEKPLINPQQSAAQAIVILTAGRIRNNPEFDDKDISDQVGLARMHYAAKLYRQTHLPVLVTGGLGNPARHSEALATIMARSLDLSFGVPVKWIEDQSANTQENALFSARILKQNNISHVMLVTDAMHMHRAKIVFEQAGLRVTPAPTQFFSRAPLGFFSFLPSAEGMRRSQYAVYEWIGLLWYQLVHIRA